MIKNYSKLVLLGCSVHAEEMLAQNTCSMQQIWENCMWQLRCLVCGFDFQGDDVASAEKRSSNSLNQKSTHICAYIYIHMYIYIVNELISTGPFTCRFLPKPISMPGPAMPDIR